MIGIIMNLLFSGHMSYGTPGSSFYIAGPTFIVAPVLGFLVSAFIVSLAWVYQDAAKRRKNSFVALVFILLTGWPLSLFWWFWLRPNPSALKSL